MKRMGIGRKRHGATLMGYALTVGLIAIIALTAVQDIGDAVRATMGETADTMSGVVPASQASGDFSPEPQPSVEQSGQLAFVSGTLAGFTQTDTTPTSCSNLVITNAGGTTTGTLNVQFASGSGFERTGCNDTCQLSDLA